MSIPARAPPNISFCKFNKTCCIATKRGGSGREKLSLPVPAVMCIENIRERKSQ